jgi:hypothetical protein
LICFLRNWDGRFDSHKDEDDPLAALEKEDPVELLLDVEAVTEWDDNNNNDDDDDD